MQKILFWIANPFHIDLSVERIVIKEIIKEAKVPYKVVKEVEKIVEIPIEKEVIKEVYIEVPTEKIIELTYKYDGDLIVKGNLVVTGYLKVNEEITCFKINNK